MCCASPRPELTAGPVSGLLIAAAALFLWATVRLDSVARYALFPSRVLSLHSAVGTAYWVHFLLSMTQVGIMVFMPLLLQVLHGVSPLWVGYYNMTFSLAWSFGSISVAGLSGRAVRRSMLGGLILAVGGLAGLAIGAASSPLWLLGGFIVAVGFGVGVTNVQAVAWTMGAALKGEESITGSALPAIRSLGYAFGAAAVGLIANAGGLGDATDPQRVATAVSWVYGFNMLTPALAGLLVARMLWLHGRVAPYGLPKS